MKKQKIPLPISNDVLKPSFVEKFESRFMPEPNSGCWLWLAYLDAAGYGRIGVHGKSRKAHRISMFIYKGQNSALKYVLHKCDNPCCVNPDHLYVGDAKENAEDRERRGRGGDRRGVRNGNFGSKNHSSKLTEDDVKKIRSLLGTIGYVRLGRMFGVASSSIQGIANGKRWGWLK